MWFVIIILLIIIILIIYYNRKKDAIIVNSGLSTNNNASEGYYERSGFLFDNENEANILLPVDLISDHVYQGGGCGITPTIAGPVEGVY